MQDFYATSQRMPLDQAHGLRRMFAGRRTRLLPLAANPHVPFSSVVLDRLAEVLAGEGQQVLLVDASATAPPAPELAQVDLASSIETISPRVAYLPARDMPVQFVDTRGCAGAFVDALQQAWPQADVVILHAEALDLARVLKRRSARPVLLAADHPESLKHAYASCKLLVQRCNLMTYDLLLAASSLSPRAAAIAGSLAGCADQFLGAVLRHSALIDPSTSAPEAADAGLMRLLQAQLSMESETMPSINPGVSTASSRPGGYGKPPERPYDEPPSGPQAWAAALAEPTLTHTAY